MRRRATSIVHFGSVCLAVLLALGAGEARAGVCSSGAFSCPAAGTCVITGTWQVGSDCVLDFGARSVELKGVLQAETVGGSFSVRGHDLTVNGGKIRSLGNTYEAGGDVTIELTGALQMSGSGPRLDTTGNGGAGALTVRAHGVTLAGTVLADGGVGEECGDAGRIDVDALDGPLLSTASIRATTAGRDCFGGEVYLAGTSVTIGNDVDARGGASASPEAIIVYATAGGISILNNSILRADGTGQPDGYGADGGEISLIATGGSVSTGTGLISATGRAPDGIAGALNVYSGLDTTIAAQVTIRGGGEGTGGDVLVEAGGDVQVSADVVTSGGESYPFGAGGTIQIRAAGALSVGGDLQSGGSIAGAVALEGYPVTLAGDVLAKASRGDGGSIEVAGCRATISGQLDAGASNGGTAGTISIAAGAVSAAATARIQALPCAATTCIAVTTRPGLLTIAPGAVLAPSPLLLTDASLPLC